MRSEVSKRMLDKTTQETKDKVSQYAKRIVGLRENRERRFHYYLDWKDLSIGFSVTQPHKCVGWKWCVSLDITFLSLWMYIGKIN